MGSRILFVSVNRCAVPEPVFPLGLACVASAARRAGHETRLVDLLAEPETLEAAVRDFKPDVVGLSLRNIDDVLIRKRETFYNNLAELTAKARRAHPCRVVLGGSGFSICPESLLELSGADFGIQGEGEASLVELVDALDNQRDYRSIPGLVYRNGGNIVGNPQRPGALPVPELSVERPAALAGYYLKTGGMLNLQTQRGCALTCAYCAYPLIEGRSHRRRKPEAVAEEFAQLQSLGAKYIFVVDSFFNSSERHVVESCEAILRRGTKLSWGCFLRPQSLTRAMMRLMARAGLAHIEFGADSLCDSVLAEYGKQLTFDDIAQSSALADGAGIEHCHYLICGGPGETMETLETSFENSRHLPRAVFMAVVGMRIFPRTPLAVRAVREGRIAADDNLLAPAYYLAEGLEEPAVFERLRDFARRSPDWLVGDPPPDFASFVARLRRRGVVGPLWSYFALLQRVLPQGLSDLTRAVPAA